MRKSAIVLVLVLALSMLAGSALALTEAQEGRKAACEAIDPGPDVTATYTVGSGAAGSNDTCVVVSTGTTITESIEQVNNANARKAVVRVVQTETTVTTTQAYRWDNRAVVAGGQVWVAEGEPLTAEEQEILSECMRNPGKDFCQ